MAALVAAVVGAGVSAAVLLLRDGDNGGDPPVSSPTPRSSASADASQPPPSGTPAAPAPAPTATRPPSSAAASKVPSGYQWVQDPGGFSLAVPDGFTRSPQGERIFYESPGRTFRIGVKVTDPGAGGPLAVMRRADADGPSTNPGYHDGRVTGTSHRGIPAALWEFSWNGFTAAEGPRHTYDLCWEEDGRMYDVWVSAPVGKAREAKEHFDVATAAFVPE
jgi:hypothetical protein